MNFSIGRSLEILTNTPNVIENLLKGLNDEWLYSNEGPDTFSPFDVIGHLIHCDKTDTMERLDIILNRLNKKFEPFDRFAMYKESKGKSIKDLLSEFRKLREMNLKDLKELNLTENELDMKGIHPQFGEVTLRQLIATWVVHDLSHIAQICRVMAKQYKAETGPWVEYLRILQK